MRTLSLLLTAALISLAFSQPAHAADHVVLISVDGLASSLLESLIANDTNGDFDNFKRLIDEGATTYDARIDDTQPWTLPNHTCMVTGRPAEQPAGQPNTVHHGYLDNGEPRVNWTLHNQGNPNLSYIASAWDVAHDNGLVTALYATKTKFVIYDRSYDTGSSAPDTTGPDDGSDKIDSYLNEQSRVFDPSIDDSQDLHDAFIADMGASHFDFTFLHYTDPDKAGHQYGWGSSQWNTTVRHVDAYLAEVFNLVETDPTLAGNTVLILTSDHGGFGSNHSDPNDSRVYRIPLFVWGAGVDAGVDLYTLNPSSRQDPGSGQLDYNASPQPIRNGGSGNFALSLLGVGPIPGSSINSAQDLVATAGVPPGGGTITYLDEDLDATAAPFGYQDDTFRGTSNPSRATGTWESSGGVGGSGAVRVEVGGNGIDMSGGWSMSFTISGSPSSVDIELSYRLFCSGGYEPDEYCQALLSVDGALQGMGGNDYLDHLVGDGSSDLDTGFVTRTLSLALTDGAHSITIGAYNNQSTSGLEITEFFGDAVKVTAELPPCITNGDCDDFDVCTLDACNAGFCEHTPNAAPCDDGDACTANDTCSSGTCVGPTPVVCDDGLFCNGAETCDPALDCQAGAPVACNDGVTCTFDQCSDPLGACVNTPLDPLCDDGLTCNGFAYCDPVLDCQAGVPVVCDDGVSCTIDACTEPAGFCSYTPDDGLCDDGLFCNGAEACDGALDCQAGIPPGDDGVTCTVDSCDESNDTVSNQPVHSICADGNGCTADSCDEIAGCVYTPVPGCTAVPTTSVVGQLALAGLILASGTLLAWRRWD